ncbi:MAG: hypothetical protein KDI55_12830, partial [Anaerolineae bacterium]|nr:hypothetical protein [Anaerolineae bacterium]
QCYHKAQYAATRISMIPGYQIVGEKPFFKEFVVRCPAPVHVIKDYLLMEWGIVAGYDLVDDYPELGECLLLCVTEMNTRQEIDDLVEALASVAEMVEDMELELVRELEDVR